MNSRVPICLLDRPWATSASTSCSRGESPIAGSGGATWLESREKSSTRLLAVRREAGAALDALKEDGFFLRDGQDHDPGVGHLRPQQAGRLQAVTPGHVDVHEDDVGHQLPRPLDGLESVRCLPHYLEVRLIAQQLG